VTVPWRVVQPAQLGRAPAALRIVVALAASIVVGLIAGVILVPRVPDVVIDAISLHAMIVLAVLFAISAPIIIKVAAGDRTILRILTLGLVLKMLSAFARIYVAFDVYGGSADAAHYDQAARPVAEALRAHWFVWPGQVDLGGGGTGTQNLTYIVGWVYRVFGANRTVGFFVMSWLSYLGLIMFYRATSIAVPYLNRHLMAGLLCFMPSLLFWPSSPGKEAWIVFSIGLTVLGAALVFNRSLVVGSLLTSAGVIQCGWIRPHIAAALAGAFGVALLLRKSPPGKRAFLGRVGPLALALAFVVTMASNAQNLDSAAMSSDAQVDIRAVALDRTQTGDSQFETKPVTNPLALPSATISVLFRPFPFEARSALQLLTSLEGLVLAYLIAQKANWRRLCGDGRTHPYVILALTYTLIFIVGFSNIANFGILARQRVQLLPFVFALLCRRVTSAELADRTSSVGPPQFL
jgi:hypothetical protein